MRKIRIEPYKTWSGGAKALGLHAGILRATNRQVQKHGDFDVVINWGRSERRFNGEYINKPECVARASNKLDAANIFAEAGVPQPDYTTDRVLAQTWVEEGHTVVERRLLRGSAGRGIRLVNPPDGSVGPAPLYTKYVKKALEYRIHVFKGEVIDVQQKKRRLDVPDEEVNYQIRNHANGWVFARDGVVPPTSVTDAAIAAVASLGLDFGAVDIGYNIHREAPAVYEVNTAPGLEGSTLDAYYSALIRHLPALRSGRYAIRRAA